jgi:sugar/nucleoside kinase (ribokinase family)
VHAGPGRDAGGKSAPLICVGEALVDLICPDPLDDPADARRFEVHFGGALANVAVAARRAGASAELAGGCGDDAWGTYLRDRLTAEGVGLAFHSVLPGVPTPFAFATLDRRSEPTFRIQENGIEQGIAGLAGRTEEIVSAAGAIVVGSNTLPGERSREVTLDICREASRAGIPIVLDPNLRPGRWPDLGLARRLTRELAAMATLLKCNSDEARWLAEAEADAEPAAAAEALLELGPELVVVTAGADPAVARGACSAVVDPPQVEVVSPLGAGDVFLGTLAAGIHADGWRLAGAGASMERAAAVAADTCTRLAAVDA